MGTRPVISHQSGRRPWHEEKGHRRWLTEGGRPSNPAGDSRTGRRISCRIRLFGTQIIAGRRRKELAHTLRGHTLGTSSPAHGEDPR
jgi:hypothetical protein